MDYKELGNAELKQKNFAKAAEFYSKGIEQDPSNKVLYSNRCLAYCSMNQFDNGLKDAEKVIELDPKWVKGYLNQGKCLHALGRLEEAEEALGQGLEIEPNNQQLIAAQQQLAQDLQGQMFGAGGIGSMFNNPNLWATLAAKPETAHLLKDKEFINKINEIKKNPASLQQYIQDESIMQALTALLSLNLNPKGFEEQQKQQSKMEEEPQPRTEKPKFEEEKPKPKPKQEEKPKAKPQSSSEDGMEIEIEGEKEGELIKVKEASESQKQEAVGHKEQGNQLYKDKKWEESLVQYEKAIELDSTNVLYRLNKASALIESQKYEEAIKVCDVAIKIGRKLFCDYQTMAKAFVRKGNAYLKQGDMEKAIKCYEESMLEHKDPEILKKVTNMKRDFEKKKEQEYINPEIAEEEKKQGNEAFKKNDFPAAIQHYREALKRNPNDASIYVNRATAYMKLGEMVLALKDSEKAIEMDPNNAKAYERKGRAHYFMKEYHKAVEAYEKGLKIEPENQALEAGMQKVMTAIYGGAGNTEQDEKERAERAKQDPEIQAILTDPVIMQVLRDIQQDPSMAGHHMKNKVIAGKIQKLINAGIVQTR